MIRDQKIKVLIVDDSLLFREVLSMELSKDRGIDVVGTASDSYIARDKIIELNPHVLVLDVEMPRMNGIEFLKKLMPQYPIPVVVISSRSENVFDALDAGAVDFVSKPEMNVAQDSGSLLHIANFMQELIVKVKIASIAQVAYLKREAISNIAVQTKTSLNSDMIIAMGASTGGTEAIYSIIKSFPNDNSVEQAYSLLESKNGRFPSDEEVAAYLGFAINTLWKLQKDMYTYHILSLDELIMDFYITDKEITTDDDTPEKKALDNELSCDLAKMLEKLTDNEKMVINLLYYEELNQKEISKVLGLTESRISQLHSRAFIKLKSEYSKYSHKSNIGGACL